MDCIGCYINLIMPWEESRAGTVGFVSPSLLCKTHLPSLSYHTVNPAQLGWQTKTTNHSPAILSHSLPQAPRVNQAHTNMSMHTHTCQKAQWKSQTCLLIFTKSVPHLALSFFCYQCCNWRMAGGHKGKTSFPASAQREGWGGGQESLTEQRGLLLLNSSTFHTPAPYSDIFGSLFSFMPSFFLFPFL